MRAVVVSVLFACVMTVWAAPLPKELAQALQKREASYYGRYLEFQFSSRYVQLKPQHQEKYSREELVKVWRAHSATKVVRLPLNGQKHVTKQGNELLFSERGGSESAYYFDEDIIVSVHPNVNLLSGAHDKVDANMLASIERSRAHLLWLEETGRADVLSTTYCVSRWWGVFTIGLNPADNPQIVWEKVEDCPNQWVLIGKERLTQLDAQRGDEYVVRLVLAKPDALPTELEALHTSTGRWSRWKIRTLKTYQDKSVRFPSLIQGSYDTSDQAVSMPSTCELRKVEAISDVPTFDLPLGTGIRDNRFRRDVHYLWQGSLPTQAELQQMMYEQGRLLPPESPRRRYSSVMFLPA